MIKGEFVANLLLSELRDMEESPLRTFIGSGSGGSIFLREEKVFISLMFIEIDGKEH